MITPDSGVSVPPAQISAIDAPSEWPNRIGAEQDRALEPQPRDQLRQHAEPLFMQITRRARRAGRIGAAVAEAAVADARIHQRITAGRVRDPLRKVPPHRDRAEPLVQEDHDRRVVARMGGRQADVFQAYAFDGDGIQAMCSRE